MVNDHQHEFVPTYIVDARELIVGVEPYVIFACECGAVEYAGAKLIL